MPTDEEIKEQEEEKDGEKLALGLVGAGILAAGTAVAVSKLADRGNDVRVKKNYTDLTSDMNSIPIIDIENRRPPEMMSQEMPVQPLQPDPPVQNTPIEPPKQPVQPEPEAPQQPAPVVSGGGSSGGGNYYPPQQQMQPEQPGVAPGGNVEPTQGGDVPMPSGSGPDLAITVPEVENIISKLKTAGKNLQDYWTVIFDTELAKLKDSWAGPDMEQYIQRVEALDPKLDKAVEAIDLLMNTYKKALEAYEEKAKQIQAAMKG